MSQPLNFLHSKADFEFWHGSVASVVNDRLRLPNQPFVKPFNKYSFEEFDWMMGDSCWPSLVNLATVSNDTKILLAVLDPDPAQYYKAEFNYYNWAIVPVDIDKNTYWSILNLTPENSPADSVLANSEIVVWLPQSLRWVIWGERSSGLCVLGSEIDTLAWKDVDWAQQLCQQGENSDFAKKLKQSFCSGVAPN
jgi:hypothetical protein